MLGNRKWLKKLGYEHIADDMLIDNPIMPDSRIYCGEKAIFSAKFGLVIPYVEIAWVYMCRHSVNGFNVDNHLNLHTKSGKKILVYAKKNEFKILMLCIASKVPGVIAGYGNEQKLKYKALLKENDKK